jgi:hypothetical protein
MDNITELMNNTSLETMIDCEDLTNNGLYFIFTGYVLPLLSPQVRSYLHEKVIFIKNLGNVVGKLVSVSEYGFNNIQNLSDNKEMVDFIERVATNKKYRVLPGQVMELAWSFSGDDDGGNKDRREETWNKLMKELDRIHGLNVLDKTTKP